MFSIRPYQKKDRGAVRAICIEAGWRGRPAGEFLDAPAIWADFWTDYYLVREPDHCWVAADSAGRVVGYLTGCADSLSAERFVVQRIVPKLAARAVLAGQWRRPGNRRFFARMLRSARRGELAVPGDTLRRYPGHYHFNLLASCRGQGLGSRLYDRFEQQMRAEGLAGLHSQVLGANELVNTFHLRRGYRLIERIPARSLDGYLEPGPVELLIYVKPLAAIMTA